jgi:hypothetical protein
VAGAAIPKATNPTVPSKNFFIVSIPVVMRAVGDRTTRRPINTGDSLGAVRRKGCIQSTTPSLK